MARKILITGGFGFIGSHFVKQLLSDHSGKYKISIVDKLTYAADPSRICGLGARFPYDADIYDFDICDYHRLVDELEPPDYIVHFAAETHVDRSIDGSGIFVKSNVRGTQSLLEYAKNCNVARFVLVSTDEVYGEKMTGLSTEEDTPRPRNPYSASKLGAEAMGFAYFNTYGTPVIITRGCNTFGKYQHPEKLIPRIISCSLRDEKVPVYGNGRQEREWISAYGHADAIHYILQHGTAGQIYNIGSGMRHTNIEMVKNILGILGKPLDLIDYVSDRPGHDRRYAMDSGKLAALGWTELEYISNPNYTTIQDVVRWYASDEGQKWLKRKHAPG